MRHSSPGRTPPVRLVLATLLSKLKEGTSVCGEHSLRLSPLYARTIPWMRSQTSRISILVSFRLPQQISSPAYSIRPISGVQCFDRLSDEVDSVQQYPTRSHLHPVYHRAGYRLYGYHRYVSKNVYTVYGKTRNLDLREDYTGNQCAAGGVHHRVTNQVILYH
ncbi:hypothetical protein CPB85DRAFT_816277 [Mucidula mucida]|nr:hypothetical protein CPB85DRAFT_816277 [Mucidula mucida]